MRPGVQRVLVTAKSIASTSVSAIEGAIEQSRGARTTQRLDDVSLGLNRLVEFAVPVRQS